MQSLFAEPVSTLSLAAAERSRVAAHIERAEQAARQVRTGGLDRVTGMVRRLLLDELTRYRTAGRFPQNPDFAEPTPYFVDARGTRCAMAHLLEVGGEAALVAKITAERNNAFVRELADEPRLLAWLAAAGLTASEAAMIQPTYCGQYSDSVCGGGFEYVRYPVPALRVLEGEVVAVQGDGRIDVLVDAVHGAGGTVVAGDTIGATVYGATVGVRVLIPVGEAAAGDAGMATLYGVELGADDTYTTAGRSVDRENFIDAVTSSDCEGTLVAAEPEWGAGTCGGGGCSAGITGSPSSLGVLLAVVAVLAARRAREASR